MPHLSLKPCLSLMLWPLVHGASCRALYRSRALLSSVGTGIEEAQFVTAQSEMLVAIMSTYNKAVIRTVCGSKRDFTLGYL